MSIWLGTLEIPMRQYLYIIQVLIAEGMFAFFLNNRRRHFWFRLGLSLLLYTAVSLVLPAVIYPCFQHNLFIVFLAFFPVLVFCFGSSLSELLFCYVAGITVQNLAYNAGITLCIAFRVSPDLNGNSLSGSIQLAAYLIVHVSCFFLCARRIKDKESFGGRPVSLAATAMVVFLIIFILEGYLDLIGQPYFSVARIMFVLNDITVLLLLFWMSEKASADRENRLLHSLIVEEYHQYLISRETMELINMKCHDIRHFLALIRRGKVLSDEMLQELDDMTSTFGAIIHTGNPALDIILTEKSLLCREKHITLTHMIDEKGLDNLLPEEIAAIFGNLLDNAIQYLQTVENQEYRVLSVSVKKCLGQKMIHVENYCQTAPASWEDGMPVTTKENRSVHGYGLRSVRYIVQKHGGVMSARVENRRFCVYISFPDEEKE